MSSSSSSSGNSNPYDTEYLQFGRCIHRISATLSVLGSAYIIQNVLRDPKKRRKVANQVVVALSFADLFYSFFMGTLGQVFAPKGIVPGAIGTVGTCAASAFIIGNGFVGSTYFNASLAITYLLMIKYGWKEEQLQKHRIYLLGIPLLFTVPMNITMIAFGGGNFNGLFCASAAPAPFWCISDVSTICERGMKLAQMPLFRLVGMTLQSVICLPIVVGCMISLYLYVLNVERNNDRYRFDGEINREQSQKVAIQGIYYVWAFLLVEGIWVAAIVLHVFVINEGEGKGKDSVQTFNKATHFIIPLQGVFNAFVYLRPSYLEYLRKNPEKTVSNRIRQLFRLEIQLLTEEEEEQQQQQKDSSDSDNKKKNLKGGDDSNNNNSKSAISTTSSTGDYVFAFLRGNTYSKSSTEKYISE